MSGRRTLVAGLAVAVRAVAVLAGSVLAGAGAESRGGGSASGAPADVGAVGTAITVQAEAVDRRDTPAAFPLPRELASAGPLLLRGPRGETLPVEVGASDGQARFVLPRLAPGQQVVYRLVPGPPPAAPASVDGGSGVQVKRETDALVVTIDGAPVFHYRTRAPAPTAEVPARYTRAGYLHPVFTPAGLAVTDDSPSDHGHHHGIWTAWTVAEYEGRRLSFWGPEPGRSKNDLVGVADIWSGRVAGGFTARLASSDLSVNPARQVLDSAWKVVVHRLPGRRPGYFLFDLDWTDKVVEQPLVLPEHRYGGLGVRGSREWLDPMKVAFLTSEGHDRMTGENTRARWVHLGGRVGNKQGGLAVLIHPLNLRAPEPVRLNPGIPLLCVSPPKAGPLRIEPGRPYSARYRFVVADGKPDPVLIERLWRDFARPPKVVVGGGAAAGGD
jgi:hypothetical protein